MDTYNPVGYNMEYASINNLDEDSYITRMSRIFAHIDMERPVTLKEDEIPTVILHTEEIKKNWGLLQKILCAYESIIRKRWLKKSKVKRAQLLKELYPEIPKQHAPDFENMRARWEGTPLNSKEDQKSMETPYLNLEDLTQGMFLPLFLNSRGRYSPHLFVHADIYAMHYGLNMWIIQEPKVYDGLAPWKSAAVFRNPDLGEYIEFLESKERSDEAYASGLGFSPPKAMLILRAQAFTYQFLVNCCSAILHDIPTLLDNNHDFNIVTEPEDISASSSQRLSTAFSAIESPYRPPSQIDFQRIEDLLEARLAAAEDHLWSLREDPSYFAEILAARDERHCYTSESDSKGFEVHNVLEYACISLLVWNNLLEDFRHWRRLEKKYSADIASDRQLPSEYERAFGRITTLSLSILSDIGIVASISRDLYLYQPWASTVTQKLKADDGTIKAITDSKWKRLMDLLKNLESLPIDEVTKLIDSPKLLSLPYRKTMRQAESLLDHTSGKTTLAGALRDLISSERGLVRTPEWVEAAPKVKKSREKRTPIDDELVSSFEHVRIEETKSTQSLEPGDSIFKAKAKSKSRKAGPSQESAALTEELPEVEEAQAPREIIKVNKKTYRVFTALFYTPSEKDPPGEISWQDFLQAMAAGGLSSEALYGSIWHFTPQEGHPNKPRRSIQFHQPHPGKLRLGTARFIGRRLNRAFGWDIDLFSLE
ncbi:hypothetical protein H4I96_02615 [Botrytis cinerea]